jgi:hypothetical protein
MSAARARERIASVPALVLAAMLLAGATTAAPRAIVLRGATLVDVGAFGSSTHDIKDAVVVMRGGMIEAVGPAAQVRLPDDARVIEVAGAYIVPGLHDVFATVNNQAQANAFLCMGVTSIVGLDEPDGRRGPLFLKASPGPRIYPLDLVTGYDESGLPGGASSLAELMTKGRRMSAPELRAQVDSLAARGVKVLLLYYSMGPDQVRTVARYARTRGLATIGELGATPCREAIEAGVMAFVHTSRYSLDLAPPSLRADVARDPFGTPRRLFYEHLVSLAADDPGLKRHARTLATRRTALIPTMAMNYLELPGHANPWREPAAVLLDPADIHLPANRETGEQELPADAVRDGFPPGVARHLQMIESAYCRAGATYLAGSGTDAFGTMAGISLHIELAMLVKAGLTPRQALAAATGNVGAMFGWPVGELKPGTAADLLVLDADPTVDIANLKRIRRVVLAGELLDREALLQRPH